MNKIISLALLFFYFMTITAIQSCKVPGEVSGNVLKFNLEKGKTYDYEILWDLNQNINGQDTRISIGGGYSINVVDENNKLKELIGMYKNFRMYMKMMGLEMDIDTEKPDTAVNETDDKQNPIQLMARIFTGIRGKSFTMQVDEEGRVISVSGFEKIISGMMDAAGGSDEMKLQMKASLQDQFNEQTIKDQFTQVFTIFPNKKVKVGDSWQKEFQMGGKLPATFSTQYTVKQVEANHVTLDAQSDIKSSAGEMKVKGNQTGVLLIDSKSGLVMNAEFDQDMDIEMQGMEIKMKSKGLVKGKEH